MLTKVRHEFLERRGVVTAVERPRAHVRRVRIGFDASTPAIPWRQMAIGAHLKLVLPDPSTGHVDLSDSAKRVARDYSIRSVPDAHSVVVDVGVHEAGPGSEWADHVEVGTAVGILGPRSSPVITADADRYIALIDASASQCAARLLEEAPPSAEVLVACAANPDEFADWPQRDGAVVAELPAGDADGLVAFLRAASPGERDVVWAAGEATMMMAVRDACRDLGLSADRVMVRGYWKQGVAGRDHHAPLEE